MHPANRSTAQVSRRLKLPSQPVRPGRSSSLSWTRLSRSVHDFSGLLLRAEREGWGLRILDPDVDTVSPTGTLLAHITAAVAEWERRIIGQRTKAALDVKRAQGVRLGRAASRR